MTRLTIAILTAALLGAAALSVVRAPSFGSPGLMREVPAPPSEAAMVMGGGLAMSIEGGRSHIPEKPQRRNIPSLRHKCVLRPAYGSVDNGRAENLASRP